MCVHYIRRSMTYSPEHPQAPPQPPVCTDHERCKECPYPHHGFRCWSKDGCCLRVVMGKINQRKENPG